MNYDTFGPEAMLGWLLRASMNGGILVVMALAISVLLRKWLAPRWIFLLWLIAIARLLMPVAPAAPFSIFNAGAAVAPVGAIEFSGPAQVSVVAPEVGTGHAPASEAAPGAGVAGPGAKSISMWSVFAVVWGAGAAAMAALVGAGQIRLRRISRSAEQVHDARVLALVEECRKRLRVRTGMLIAESRVASPVLMGCIGPVLLIPLGLREQLGERELRSIIMHEVAHVRRGDIALGWIATLALVLHWFNPLVWVAVARMKIDRELACDALALSALDDAERPAYGHTLIALLEKAPQLRVIPGLAAIAEHHGDMNRRLKMIAGFRPARPAAAFLSAGLLALLACVGLTDAQPPRPVSPAVEVGEPPEGLTADAVLRAVAKVYASSESYEDEGVVATSFPDTPGLPTTYRPFTTAFARPKLLRYEFTEDRTLAGVADRQYVVWSDGERIRSWWALQPEARVWQDVDRAIAGPTGVSGGSATAILPLLLPEMRWGMRVTQLADAKLVAVDRIDDVLCLRIEGTIITGDSMTVWVDAESMLVRRTVLRQMVDPAILPEDPAKTNAQLRLQLRRSEAEMELLRERQARLERREADDGRGAALGQEAKAQPFRVETTITFKPRLNQAIPAERFRFEPPAGRPAVEAGEAVEYTVKAGDTLGRIARAHYGHERYKDLILEANRDRVPDETRLKVGQKLRLPPKPE